MKNTDWPKDGKAADFSDLADAVRDTIRHCYTLKRKNKNVDVDWNGPDLPECMQATCLTFDEQLQADKLKYSKEDQGRSAIDVIIGIALQLGIEQGRRMYKWEAGAYHARMRVACDTISGALFDLRDKK